MTPNAPFTTDIAAIEEGELVHILVLDPLGKIYDALACELAEKNDDFFTVSPTDGAFEAITFHTSFAEDGALVPQAPHPMLNDKAYLIRGVIENAPWVERQTNPITVKCLRKAVADVTSDIREAEPGSDEAMGAVKRLAELVSELRWYETKAYRYRHGLL